MDYVNLQNLVRVRRRVAAMARVQRWTAVQSLCTNRTVLDDAITVIPGMVIGTATKRSSPTGNVYRWNGRMDEKGFDELVDSGSPGFVLVVG